MHRMYGHRIGAAAKSNRRAAGSNRQFAASRRYPFKEIRQTDTSRPAMQRSHRRHPPLHSCFDGVSIIASLVWGASQRVPDADTAIGDGKVQRLRWLRRELCGQVSTSDTRVCQAVVCEFPDRQG